MKSQSHQPAPRLISLASLVMMTLGCVGVTISLSAPEVTTLRVPAGGIQPQAAVDGKGVIHIVYFQGEPGAGDVFYRRSQDGGVSFSDPIRVNSQEGSAIAIGNIRGAHLAVGRNGRVHVAWVGSSKALPKGPPNPAMPVDSPYNGTPMLYTRLNDEGTSFEPQRNLVRLTYGLDGGGSVAADETGNVYVAWHAGGEGSKGEAERRVWVARSTDEGKTFTRESAVWSQPTGACGCCGLRAFTDQVGRVYVLYRAATNNVDRDMYLLMSTDRGRTFQGTLVHRWRLQACPMSSMSLSESAGKTWLAWETDGQVFYARFDPATRTMSRAAPAPGPADGRKHPVIVANAGGEALLAWTEGMGWNRGGAVAWQVFDKDGQPIPDASGRMDGVPVWSLVAAFARPNGGFSVVY